MTARLVLRRWIGAIGAAFAVLIAVGAATAQEAPRPAVGVAAVELADVTPRDRFTGRVEAIDRVELIARVTGFVDQRLFTQGELVTEGDGLFVIEKAPYEAILAQRRAELASARAEVENAAAQLARGEALLENNNIPAAEVDERRARLLIAQATVLEAEAAIQSAEIDLGYTDITAPVTGRIGRYNYSVGAYVGPESGALATIVRQDPVYVTFPVSQAILTEVRQEALERGGSPEVVVRAELPTGDMYEPVGTIEFAEVEVDAGTDTLSIRATFPNADGLLTPGQFLNVIIERGEPLQALVVPTAALLVSQAGTQALVVGEDGTVEARTITLGEGGEGGDVVVSAGLNEGERIIVEGIQKVRPGQQVEATLVAGVPGT